MWTTYALTVWYLVCEHFTRKTQSILRSFMLLIFTFLLGQILFRSILRNSLNQCDIDSAFALITRIHLKLSKIPFDTCLKFFTFWFNQFKEFFLYLSRAVFSPNIYRTALFFPCHKLWNISKSQFKDAQYISS